MSLHTKIYENISQNSINKRSRIWPVDTIKRFAIKMLWDSTSVRTTSMPDRIAESNANALRLCCHHRIMGWNPFWMDVFAKLHYNHKKFLQFFPLLHMYLNLVKTIGAWNSEGSFRKYFDTDTFVRQKGEPGQVPVPIPPLKQTNNQELKLI